MDNIGYENSPACVLVATHCACCGRPLVDAKSVEIGMGPYCRKKHGYGDAQGPADIAAATALVLDIPSALAALAAGDTHRAANTVVYQIAARQDGADVSRWVAALNALGFAKLASIIAKRLGAVRVTVEGSTLIVETPFNEKFNMECRKVPGSSWNKPRKVRCVPATSRQQLWTAIKAAFEPGTLILGTKSVVL